MGMERVVNGVDSENSAFIHLMKRLWFTVTPNQDDGVIGILERAADETARSRIQKMDVENSMSKVWVLRHIHLIDDDEDQEDVKLIGIYSSQERAAEALKRAILLPGFAENPDGFELTESTVDRDGWTSGFITTGPINWGPP